jgi:hypothetical protein
MKKKDLVPNLLLIGIVLFIFYPVFFGRYVYTDEAVQLWMYRKGSGFQMFSGQGRYVTEKMVQWLFNSIHSINQITYLRLVSLSGWIVCIPAWYSVIKKIVQKEGLPAQLTLFSLVYLICMPPFAMYVGWAAVMEMFLANTAGLFSGYFLYRGIRADGQQISLSFIDILLSIITGCFSLFTYQNGFGCFLLPFILHLMASPKSMKRIFIATGVYIFIYVVYYAAFRLLLTINHMQASERTGVHINVGNKLPFFIARPLASAFHFTWIFNERNVMGLAVYIFLAAAWLLVYFLQHKKWRPADSLQYLLMIFCVLGLIYLPSLIVKENYASNRTLFALNMAVFFLFSHNMITILHREQTRKIAVAAVSIVFVGNAWYNFNKQFLRPVVKEYAQIRNFVELNYHPSIDTVFFIRPPEDFFVKKYGITRSWDEFGVPSTFFDWTPEFLVKQIVFEKTGDRELAEKLVVKSSLLKQDIANGVDGSGPRMMIIDGPAILLKD